MQNNNNESRTTESEADCCPVLTIRPAGSDLRLQSRVKLLAALADPTRLHIVEMLSQLQEPLCVCDITSQFDLGQPTISHHLKVLRDVKLVHWEKRGLWVYYSLNRAALEPIAGYLDGLLAIGQAVSSV